MRCRKAAERTTSAPLEQIQPVRGHALEGHLHAVRKDGFKLEGG